MNKERIRMIEKERAKPAHNKRYTLRRLFGGSGFEKHQSGLRPLWCFLSPTFQPTALLRKAL